MNSGQQRERPGVGARVGAGLADAIEAEEGHLEAEVGEGRAARRDVGVRCVPFEDPGGRGAEGRADRGADEADVERALREEAADACRAVVRRALGQRQAAGVLAGRQHEARDEGPVVRREGVEAGLVGRREDRDGQAVRLRRDVFYCGLPREAPRIPDQRLIQIMQVQGPSRRQVAGPGCDAREAGGKGRGDLGPA